MTFSKNSFVGVLILAAAASALVFSLQAGASGSHHGKRGQLFRSGLVGNVLTDPPIHGVNRAGAPWVLERGAAKLSRNGRFVLRVKGLVLAANGTTGTVRNVVASFFCAPDSNTVPAFNAGPVPLSADGDARIKETVTVPARCLAPVVLLRIQGAAPAPPGSYIAASGFTG
jgi:hypothetical protein